MAGLRHVWSPAKYRMNSWSNLKRLTPAATPLLDLDAIKAYVHATDDDDDLIASLIEAATDFIEGPNGIGSVLISSQWRQSFDDLNLSIALNPIQSVDQITVLTDTGSVDLDLDLIHVAADQTPAKIVILADKPVAKRVPGAVSVTFTAGYGDTPSMVPADLRHAALWLVANWYENRGDDASKSVIPPTVDRVLNKYRSF